jgi:DNA repair exonuclease SbcCD nuclease subunit
MNPIRILHAADHHLDSPFDGLSPEQAVQRRQEQRQLLERMGELARTERVDLVLLAGDLLDGDRVYYETAQALARVLGQIPCPVCVAPGNHDPFTPRSPYAVQVWPDNVHIFRSPQVESVELPELNAVVHGAAFTQEHREDSPLKGFTAPDDGRLHLMVLHGDVDARPDSPYAPLSTQEIAHSGLDYLALGHIHTCTGVRWAGQVPWAYAGCPEGRGFDETGPKGVLLGQVGRGSAQLEFVPLCRRQYKVLELPVAAEDDVQTIAQRALAHAAPQDLVRFVLTGESGVAGVDVDALQALCAGGFYSVSFRDRTQVRQDLWARVDEENLTGLFLQAMRRQLDQAEDRERIDLLQRATRFGLAALENREDLP